MQEPQYKRIELPESFEERAKLLKQYNGRKVRVINKNWYTGEIETSMFVEGENLESEKEAITFIANPSKHKIACRLEDIVIIEILAN